MTVQDWAALILAILSIFVIFVGGIRWLVKHYIGELKTNGGTSMKDQMCRLEKQAESADINIIKMSDKLEKMYMILLDFVAKK